MILTQAKQAYQDKDFVKAEKLYTLYLKKNSEDAEVIYQRGMSKLHQNKLLECLEDLIQACKLEPNNAYRHSCVAFIYSKLNKNEKAIEAYQRAITLDPDDAIAHNNLGILEEKRGNVVHAKKLYHHADSQMGIKPQGIKETKTTSTLNIILEVFTKKKRFKEFMGFIKQLIRQS